MQLIKIKLIIACALCVATGLFSSGAIAQNLPLNVIQSGLSGNDSKAEQKVIAIPDPLKLDVTWWRYVETAKVEALQGKLDEFYERIEKQIQSLSKEDQEALLSTQERIRSAMATYIKYKTKVDPEPKPRPVVFEKYSLNQLIDLLKVIRDTSNQIGRDQLELDELDKQIKSSERSLDTLTAAYLELDKANPKKFSLGLEIIAQRFERAALEERTRIRHLENTYLRNYLNELELARESATKRIEAGPDERQALEQEIKQANNVVNEAAVRLAKEQASSIAINQVTEEDKAAVRYRSQRLLRAQVVYAISEVALLSLYNERDLLALLTDEAPNIEELQQNLAERKSTLADWRSKTDGWLQQNEADRLRSSDLPNETGSKEDDQSFIKLINQDRVLLSQETLTSLQQLQALIDDTQFLVNLTEQSLLSGQGFFNRWWGRALQNTDNIWIIAQDKLNTSLFKIGDTPVTALGFARLLLIVVTAWWVAFWINNILIRLGKRGEGDQLPAYYLVGRLSYYSVILIGFFSGLAAVGIDFTNFALVAGALAIGLGFGLQSIVSNFVSGLILLFERSIKVGDFIELQGGEIWGEVKEINVRATIITNNDSVDIIVPNSEFINTKMLNWTLMEPIRRVRFPFRVSFGTDKELVREAVLLAAESIPHTLKGTPGRNPSVWLVDFGEFGYHFELVVWLTPRAVKRPNAMRAAYMWAIDNALRENNIEIPVPQREVRFKESAPIQFEHFKKPVSDEIEDCDGV